MERGVATYTSEGMIHGTLKVDEITGQPCMVSMSLYEAEQKRAERAEGVIEALRRDLIAIASGKASLPPEEIARLALKGLTVIYKKGA